MYNTCNNCEHRILSECSGMDDTWTGVLTCFLDNQYGLATNSKELARQTSSYKARSNMANATSGEIKEMIISDVLNLDVHLNGVKSELYPVWNYRRAVSITHCLEIYQRLNVNLTLAGIRVESFYAGIPLLTADDIKQCKKILADTEKTI